MTGLEAIWIPMVAGAVTGGGVAAAKGGSFGDIAKGAGIGAAGGAVSGGLASGLGAGGGAIGGSSANAAADAITTPPTDGAIAPNLASQQVSVQNIPETQPNLMATLNKTAMPVPAGMPSYALPPNMQGSVEQQFTPANLKPEPWQMTNEQALAVEQQPTTKGKGWTTADYINATSSAANLAANIAQTPPSPPSQIAPMPAIFSGQGGDLMQQLSQLSQG